MGYSVGDKFVIEIKEIDDFKNHIVLEKIAVDIDMLDKLERLDSDYVNEHYGELQDEAYNKGLEDAEEALHKVYDMGCEEIEKIFDVTGGFYEVICYFTAQTIIEKLEAYEKEHAEIKVGDVFEFFYSRCSVVKVTGSSAMILWKSGKTGEVPLEFLKKQKKVNHIDIQSVLQQIGGAV